MFLQEEKVRWSNKLFTTKPLFIFVLVTAIVGSGIFLSDRLSSGSRFVHEQQERQSLRLQLLEVSENDHIIGDRDAPVKLIQYSDSDCPFCKRLISTLENVSNNYSGDVVWIYRHSQLSIYPNSIKEAEAMECAFQQRGEEIFFAYRSAMYDIKLTGNSLQDRETLVSIAQTFGLDEVAFYECLVEERFREKVDQERLNGAAAGVGRVPYTFIISPSGTIYEVVGNKPYHIYTQLIDIALSER